MARSLLQVANPSTQTVAEGGVINLGSVIRRFGCNSNLNGTSIEIQGQGYYAIDLAVTVAPETAGDVTVAIYNNGVLIPGAIAYGTAAAAGDAITMPIITTVRQGCACMDMASITVVLITGASDVQNISVRIVKL